MKFNLGDIVKMNGDILFKIYGKLPSWYNSGYYMITNFTGKYDSDGFPIVTLNKKISGDYLITTKYIIPGVKEQRKLKLKKIYESNL